jgi:type IV pilus assembly protein PilM
MYRERKRVTFNVVGIDIGSVAVRAVEVSTRAKLRPRVLRCEQIALPPGAVISGEVIEPEIVTAALKELWSVGKFTTRDVVLGVGNERVLVRDLSLPRMPLDRIRELLPFEVQDVLPLPVSDALLDFYPISDADGDGGPMVNGLLVAAAKEAVLRNVLAVQKAGLRVLDVDLIPFALCRALVPQSPASGTVAIIDVGGNTTSVVIATDGVPQFVRIIPTGGDDVTQALTVGLETETATAQQIKHAHVFPVEAPVGPRTGADAGGPGVLRTGETEAEKIIAQITGEQLRSLLNTIRYFTNTRPNGVVQRILLSGGGTRAPGFADALARLTGIPVSVGDPFAGLTVVRPAQQKLVQSEGAVLTVALGLALGARKSA